MPIELTKKDIAKLEKDLQNSKINIIKKGVSDEKLTQKEMDKLDKFNFKDLGDKDKFLYALAFYTEDYTGADIKALCQEAAMSALRKNPDAKLIKLKDFIDAMLAVRPSVNEQKIKEYNEILEKMDSRGVAEKGEDEIGIEVM